MTDCYCGSGIAFNNCCAPIIADKSKAATAESLMRARYSAYASGDIDFIMNSTHPDGRGDSDEAAMRAWAEQAQWQSLEILGTEAGLEADKKGKVEFIAHYALNGAKHHHHELAEFVRENGVWFFHDGDVRYTGPSEKPKPVVNEVKIGRNDPCICGSGKKYKKCCGA